jgi:hypothetical protein
VYAALIKDKKKTRKNILNHDQEINQFNNRISPKRFKEGGAAILQPLNINHQKDILGIRFNKPRLFFSSHTMALWFTQPIREEMSTRRSFWG